MKIRFVFYVALSAIAITAVGALADARMGRSADTIVAGSVSDVAAH